MKVIELENVAGGAFAEKLNDAIYKVVENIQDPNTEATKIRKIMVEMKFKPLKNRQMANLSITVTKKLAESEAAETQMIMGINMRTGEIEAREYNGQIPGQMNFSDMEMDSAPITKSDPIDLRRRKADKEATNEEYSDAKVRTQ